MNRLTPAFLVLLRLAIGWHIFFEGIEKVGSNYAEGPQPAKPWTSEPYLRESSAPTPLGPAFRWLPGDPTLERVAPLPLAENQDPSQTPPHTRFPPVLAKEWDAYFEKFVAHYDLTPEQRQMAEAKFRQLKDHTVNWMLTGKLKVKRAAPWAPRPWTRKSSSPNKWTNTAPARRSPADRTDGRACFKPTATKKLQAAKVEANRLRTELQVGVDAQTAEMQKALGSPCRTKRSSPPISADGPTRRGPARLRQL